jgi:hypothetical protein
MIDELPGLTDRVGKSVLSIEVFPLAAVVQLDQMTQGATGAEELPFGIYALDFRGVCLGHGLGASAGDSSVSQKVVKIESIAEQP